MSFPEAFILFSWIDLYLPELGRTLVRVVGVIRVKADRQKKSKSLLCRILFRAECGLSHYFIN